MPLHIAPALAAAALLVSLYLFLAASPRLVAGVAALVAAAELTLALGWLRVAVHGATLALALGLGLALPGLVLWWRAGGKGPLSAASVLAFIGLLQVTLAILARV
jgi:hypothetical protein